ncbi:leucine-rich repeat-containing protein [Tanacetum coccineum]
MCIGNERQALLGFKAHLLDPFDLLSTWSGVRCDDQTGHVTTLDLCDRSNYPYKFYDKTGGVGGEISLSLLNLTYLNHLDLHDCSFHGTIPPFIGSMTHLTYLDLSNNKFTDHFIPRWIGSLTGLTSLNLRGNQFVGTIPEFIGNMTQLISLDLSYNQFTGTFPKSICSLAGLTSLYLEGNQFVGTIPMYIGSLTNLTDLKLGHNNFSGTIPEFIGSLTNLEGLDLGSNNFCGTIPRSIGSLTKLQGLTISDNPLYGTIPPEFGNLTNLYSLLLDDLGSCTVENLDWLSSLSSLSYLDMSGTSLAKVNVILGLQNLQELYLGRCDLSKGMHPYSSVVNSSSSIVTLDLHNNNLNSSSYRWLCPLLGNSLKTLDVSGNSFDGKLSDFLNNLSRCTSLDSLYLLDASNNQLTGSSFGKIQNFSSLNTLNLNSNQLYGTMSDTLWQLPSLAELHLSSNFFRGVIPGNIGKSNLWDLDLSRNSFEGVFLNDDVSNLSMTIQFIDFSSNKLGPRFPKSMQKMKNLIHLDLSNNSISDTIPIEYWNQWRPSQLRYLDLSFNNIIGKLPESFSSPDLEKVDLSSNSFYGPIPTFPARISFLDLSRNSFIGKLPDSLKNLTYLEVLNLGHNTLSGYIPPYVGCLGQLETLCLYNNSFSGELPLSMKNCTKLSLLDLGANNLYGNIPVWIGKNFSRLYVLSLKSNNFSGAIPSQICQLASLQILDLSFNNLHGAIPSCVHNLTSMVQKGLFTEHNIHHYISYITLGHTSFYFNKSYIDHLLIEWQGKENEFGRNLRLVKTIDLSTNNLTGHIPYEITNLHGLVLLNLSHNALLGEIPKDIGQMKELQILDLSKNSFSGGLPSSMSKMNFLNYLDVSHNNLSGRIPSGAQLETSEPSRYIGNAGLCGPPLTKYCPGDKELEVTPVVGEGKSDGEAIDELKRWFYIGGTAGYVTGFWIVVGALFFNRRARHAFFQCHDSLKDWVYVKVMVFMAKWRSVARA